MRRIYTRTVPELREDLVHLGSPVVLLGRLSLRYPEDLGRPEERNIVRHREQRLYVSTNTTAVTSNLP